MLVKESINFPGSSFGRFKSWYWHFIIENWKLWQGSFSNLKNYILAHDPNLNSEETSPLTELFVWKLGHQSSILHKSRFRKPKKYMSHTYFSKIIHFKKMRKTYLESALLQLYATETSRPTKEHLNAAFCLLGHLTGTLLTFCLVSLRIWIWTRINQSAKSPTWVPLDASFLICV